MDRRPSAHDRIRGCLLGGAVGDALGAPVEFLDLGAIRTRFGAGGIRDFAPAYGRAGAITDDTQMTLFTAEGLLRARNRGISKGICHAPSVVLNAYRRWHLTQEPDAVAPGALSGSDGWLGGEARLHARRAPGNTCLSALESRAHGTIEEPINDSKGCGAVMRVAPVGLIRADDPFGLACEIGALTHGHPSGYLPAGVLALLIARLVDGAPLGDAVRHARVALCAWRGHQEMLAALDAAEDLADRAGAALSGEDLATLGGGWTGEQALSIALACCLCAEDFETAVALAVNHAGDSDSTGSIAGQIWGAMCGVTTIPDRFLEELELRDVIETLADDLHGAFHAGIVTDPEDGTYEWDRYPGA